MMKNLTAIISLSSLILISTTSYALEVCNIASNQPGQNYYMEYGLYNTVTKHFHHASCNSYYVQGKDVCYKWDITPPQKNEVYAVKAYGREGEYTPEMMLQFQSLNCRIDIKYGVGGDLAYKTFYPSTTCKVVSNPGKLPLDPLYDPSTQNFAKKCK